MTTRVAVGFLAILTAGLIASTVETFARGGAFAGGRGMSFHRGFRAPIIRPAIARPLPVAVHRRVHTAPLARFRPRHAPAVRWPGAPWYEGYDQPTYVVPDEQSPPNVSPTTVSDTKPARLGCGAQTYSVPSEGGGKRSVKVVRC